MRILITGSSGYLGSKVVLLLHKEQAEIFGLDIKEPSNKECYSHFEKGSVTDEVLVRRFFEAAKPDVAVHLAFVVNPLHDESKEDEVALSGARNFLNGCDRHNVGQVVFVSSAAAYGAHSASDFPYTEDSAIRGNDTYAYSRLKAKTDKLASRYMAEHPGCKFVILRPCLFVGPNTNNSFFEVLKFPLLPQFYDVGGVRDPEFQFIHEDDMAACVVAAVAKDVRGIFNIAADGFLRYSELGKLSGKRGIALPAWILYTITNLLWKLRVVNSPPGQLDFIRYPWIMDNSKMKKELYQPKYSSKEAFESFVRSRFIS